MIDICKCRITEYNNKESISGHKIMNHRHLYVQSIIIGKASEAQACVLGALVCTVESL